MTSSRLTATAATVSLTLLLGASNVCAYYYTSVTTARHKYTGITAEEVDAKMEGVGSLLQDVSPSCYDYPCCVSMMRHNDLETLDVADNLDRIINDTELAIVQADARNVKIVTAMQDVAGASGPVIGVTLVGQWNTVIVYDAIANAWAHELGHMHGLVHDDGCDGLIMNSAVEATDNAVYGQPQCLIFMQGYNQYDDRCGTAVRESFVATGGARSVTLTWEEFDPTYGAGYILWRGESCWGPFTQLREVASHDRAYTSDDIHYSYLDQTATLQQTYYYELTTPVERVRAAAVPIGGDPVSPPSIPSSLTAVGYWREGRGPAVTLVWQPSGGSVEGYHVFRADYAGMDTCVAWKTYLGATSSASWVDTTVNSVGIPVFYRVRAFSSNTGSDISDEVEAHRTPVILMIVSNPPGATFSDGGSTVSTGDTGYAVPCSTMAISSVRTISVSPQQVIGGTKYCFDSWSDSGARTHTITLLGDSTITLNLVPSGSGPTTYTSAVSLPSELFDCRGPYIFQDNATADNGLTVYPGTKLRFRPRVGSGPMCVLSVYGGFKATDAVFETTDSTANTNPVLWSGINTGGLVEMRRCTVRNGNAGVGTNASAALVSAAIDSCTFERNLTDIQLEFAHTHDLDARSLRIAGNVLRSQYGIQVTGASHPDYSDPPVPAVIDSNTYSPPRNGSTFLEMSGGFTGYVNSNNMSLDLSNTKGIVLNERGDSYPNVWLTGNKFQSAANRMALQAPRAAGHPSLTAYYNDWSLYTSESIGAVITDWFDTMGDPIPRAEVFFEPFTVPSGGGGGGGGGGCPYVLIEDGDNFQVENTILGESERDPRSHSLVSDVYPLARVAPNSEGRIRVRIAEWEQETSRLDRVMLAALPRPEGGGVAPTPDGRVLPYATGDVRLEPLGGGSAPPAIPPSEAVALYSGVDGDSLEFEVHGAAGTPPGKSDALGVGIYFRPKPTGRKEGASGVTLRVSPDADGERWTSVGPLIPRENWSMTLVPLDDLGVPAPRRARIVWHSYHAIGWIGIVRLGPAAAATPLRCVAASHSSGRSVRAALEQEDGAVVVLKPGEHIDLEFDAHDAIDGSVFVLQARGRYDHGALSFAADELPARFSLQQVGSNPFNPETSFELRMPNGAHVDMRIFDAQGRFVRVLEDRDLPAGTHRITWDGKSRDGTYLASGVYFLDLRAGEFTSKLRVVLLR